MAGDWIKVEHGTLDKPEVSRFSDLLNISHGEGVELLLRFWMWMDLNASDICPGIVRKMSGKYLDNVLHCTGFSGALTSVGWLEIDEKTGVLTVPNFAHHNGSTAKTRALDAKRKRQARLDSVRKMSEKNRTREEKRREETTTTKTTAPSALDVPQWLDLEAWQEWIDYRGKKLTPHGYELCLSKLDRFRKAGADPAEIIRESIASGWSGLFDTRKKGSHGKTDRRAETYAGLTGGSDDGEKIIDLKSRTG